MKDEVPAVRSSWLALGSLAVIAILSGKVKGWTHAPWVTVTLWCSQVYLVVSGTKNLWRVLILYNRQVDIGFFEVFEDLCRCLPIVSVKVMGEHRLFSLAHRQFDRSRAKQDGAAVAALLESTGLVVGSPWWIHRGEDEKDTSFPPEDKRRHWQEGRVVSIGDEAFQVAVLASGRRSRTPWRTSNGLLSIPLPQRLADPQELASQCRAELRCMDWRNVTEALMATNTTTGGEYSLSRSVAETEVIDYFLTHSWHDSAERKWQVLSKTTVELQAKHAREMTLWLDKTCIDQTRIRDGLTVLPVVVMSCKCLLCLWGPTYPSRLWCVWELFTLIAFGSLDGAAERLLVKPLDVQDATPAELLSKFDVRSARCYDPNEQARLLEVISALGIGRFNERIRGLGHKLDSRATALGGAGTFSVSALWRQFASTPSRQEARQETPIHHSASAASASTDKPALPEAELVERSTSGGLWHVSVDEQGWCATSI